MKKFVHDDINSFSKSVKNSKEKQQRKDNFFRRRKQKITLELWNVWIPSTISKSSDKLLFIATTSNSATLSDIGISLIAIPMSTEVAWSLPLGKSNQLKDYAKSKINIKNVTREQNRFLIVLTTFNEGVCKMSLSLEKNTIFLKFVFQSALMKARMIF